MRFSPRPSLIRLSLASIYTGQNIFRWFSSDGIRWVSMNSISVSPDNTRSWALARLPRPIHCERSSWLLPFASPYLRLSHFIKKNFFCHYKITHIPGGDGLVELVENIDMNVRGQRINLCSFTWVLQSTMISPVRVTRKKTALHKRKFLALSSWSILFINFAGDDQSRNSREEIWAASLTKTQSIPPTADW